MMNPANETDMMICDRMQCKMMKRACVSRQKLNPEQHERRFGRLPGCDGCKQGEQIKAELSGKGEFMESLETDGPYHCNVCGSDDKTRQEMEIIYGKVTKLCKKCKSDRQKLAYRDRKMKKTESEPEEIQIPVETSSSMEFETNDIPQFPVKKIRLAEEELNALRISKPSRLETMRSHARELLRNNPQNDRTSDLPADHENAKSITLVFSHSFATLYEFLIDHARQNLRTPENQILWELKCLSESIDRGNPFKQLNPEWP